MPKKQRLTVESGLRAPEVTPSFPRFNDSYVPGASARGARSDLDQLARGLSEFNRGVTPFLTQMANRRMDEAEAEGKLLKQEGQDLPPDASPDIRRGYATEAGYDYEGQNFTDTLSDMKALRDSGITPTVEDFDKAYEANANENAEAFEGLLDDDDFRVASGDARTAYVRGESQNIARASADKEASETVDRLGNNSALFATESMRTGATDAEIIEGFDARVQEAIDEYGLTPAVATQAVIEASLRTAERGAEFGLDIEERKRLQKLAGEVALKEGPAKFSRRYSDRMEEVYGKILRDEEGELRTGNASTAAAERKGYNEALTQYHELTDDSFNAHISEKDWDAMEDTARGIGGEGAVERVRDLRKVHGKGYDNAQITGDIYQRFMSGETNTAQAIEEIDAAMRSGQVTPQTAASMTEDLNEFGPHGVKGSDMPKYDSDLYKLYVGRDLQDTFGVNPQYLDQYQKARGVMYQWLRQPEVWEAYRTAPAHVKRNYELAAFRYATGQVEITRGE